MFLSFKNGVKSIQTPGYNGAHSVSIFHILNCKCKYYFLSGFDIEAPPFPISLCRKTFAKEFNLHFNQTPVYFSHPKINVKSKIFQWPSFQIRLNQIISLTSFLNL